MKFSWVGIRGRGIDMEGLWILLDSDGEEEHHANSRRRENRDKIRLHNGAKRFSI
jgi:hypothetical protein